MKKIILIFIAMGAIVFSATAQKTSVGVKAGANVSSVTVPNVDKISTLTGFCGGLFAEFKPKRVGWQAELLYSREGFKQKFQSEDLIVNSKMHYLNIPLIMRYYAADWLSLDFGYQLGLLWDAKENSDKANFEKRDMENVRSTNESLVMGITFVRNNRIDVSARYIYGFSDLINKKEGSMVRSQVWQFTWGYRF